MKAKELGYVISFRIREFIENRTRKYRKLSQGEKTNEKIVKTEKKLRKGALD